ncbi:bone marrow stromal antigen 2 [Thomomys bottae]
MARGCGDASADDVCGKRKLLPSVNQGRGLWRVGPRSPQAQGRRPLAVSAGSPGRPEPQEGELPWGRPSSSPGSGARGPPLSGKPKPSAPGQGSAAGAAAGRGRRSPRSSGPRWRPSCAAAWKMKTSSGCGPRLGAALAALALLAAGLAAALGVVAARCAPGDGRAERECRNATDLLRGRLARAQDGLLRAEGRAQACNRTLATLAADLERKNSENRERQEQVIQGLQEENGKLRQRLQEALAELEQRRAPKEMTRTSPSSSARSLATAGIVVTAGLLLLGRAALLP